MNKDFQLFSRFLLVCAALMAAPFTSWVTTGSNAYADEGMWLLGKTDPKAMALARGLGLQLTDSELYGEDGLSLKDCVVNFSGYCSGVIVSADGLLFTNHHCGFRAIQQLSTPEDDILGNGFVARSRDEERPAKDLFVRIWQRTVDVTAQVNHELDSIYAAKAKGKTLKDKEKAEIYDDYINGILNSISAKAETKATQDGEKGVACDCKAFYGGSVYYLNYYRQYSDIRLVFTVPQAVGKFGGDTDNWMWPRQTADFSVFRVYADSLGQPAEYSETNVPLHPKRWARVSLDGYEQGSYCMTIGYPGSTSRYLSSYGIDERVNVSNIPLIQVRGVKQEVWKRWMNEDRSVGIKYASKYASSSNYWKNSMGMNEAVKRLGIITQKEQREQDIRRWYSADAQLHKRFSTMFPALKQAYTKRHDARYAYGFMNETFYRGIEIITFARLSQAYHESYSGESIEEYVRSSYKDYDARVDEEVMATLLENYATQVGSRYLPSFYSEIRKKYKNDYRAYARDVFAKSKLTSYEGWYALTHATVKSSVTYDSEEEQALADKQAYAVYVAADPVMSMNQAIIDMAKHVMGKTIATTTPIVAYNENLLTQAVLEMEQDKPHYSDANFTQRMSYGIVSDYTNSGVHQDYMTTMPSLIEKIEKGADNPDYRVQKEILDLFKRGDYGRYADAKTRQLPLCFLTTNDITGGNSGSPMFNGRGELIGLAFDGNWDALSSDISFDSALQRCIGVDIRFVLWLMEKWGGAYNLVKELETPSPLPLKGES